MFPEAFHPVEGQAHGIQTAPAGFRFQGRMGRFSVIGQLPGCIGQAFDVRLGGRSPMHHQGHIQLLKGAAVPDHDVFAADVLFPGSPVHRQGEGTVSRRLLDGQSSSQDGRTLHLVAAAMAHPRQGIVFAQKPQVGSSFPVFPHGPESGFQSSHTPGNGKPMGFQPVRQKTAGKDFMRSDFRVVKNPVRHFRQFFCISVHTDVGTGNHFFQHFILLLQYPSPVFTLRSIFCTLPSALIPSHGSQMDQLGHRS